MGAYKIWNAATGTWDYVGHDGPTGPSGVLDYIQVEERQNSGVNGSTGDTTLNQWNTRVLTTEVRDTGGHCSLNIVTYRITLDAGTYESHITVCFGPDVGGNKARLRNITDGVTVLVGTSNYAHNSGGAGSSKSEMADIFTIAAGKDLEIQEWHSNNAAGGYSNGIQVGTGEAEVYTIARFWKRP